MSAEFHVHVLECLPLIDVLRRPTKVPEHVGKVKSTAPDSVTPLLLTLLTHRKVLSWSWCVILPSALRELRSADLQLIDAIM